jgi:hypothetical protein
MDLWNELITSPLNMLLLAILVGLIYMSFAPAKARPVPVNLDKMMPPPLTEKKEYTLEELAEFDGTRQPRILMGVLGKVYDVTRGRYQLTHFIDIVETFMDQEDRMGTLLDVTQVEDWQREVLMQVSLLHPIPKRLTLLTT